MFVSGFININIINNWEPSLALLITGPLAGHINRSTNASCLFMLYIQDILLMPPVTIKIVALLGGVGLWIFFTVDFHKTSSYTYFIIKDTNCGTCNVSENVGYSCEWKLDNKCCGQWIYTIRQFNEICWILSLLK